MINATNNNINFGGTARLVKYGQEALVVKTTKYQDKIFKAMADDMGKRGEMLLPSPKNKAITFQRYIETIFGKEIDFGKKQKYLSNMQTISQATKGELNNFIMFGTKNSDKVDAFNFTLDLRA